MKNPRVSLEQWLAFKTVVDCGSYAMAAQTLNKSQSSISYAIARLNEQLPQPVLILDGRKAVMTDAGQVLYRHAEQLLNQASQAEAIASSLALGFESEVAIAVDVLVEVGSLVCAFEEFSQEFPHTRIRVLETSLSGTTEALLEKTADLSRLLSFILLSYPFPHLASVRSCVVVAFWSECRDRCRRSPQPLNRSSS